MAWIPILVGMSVLFVVISHFGGANQRKKIARFSDRETFSFDEIYEKYFSGQNIPKDIVAKLWVELADTLELPSGKLRPTDSFHSDLAPEKGWEFDDQLGAVTALVIARFKKIGKTPDFSEIKTIMDYIIIQAKIEQDNR